TCPLESTLPERLPICRLAMSLLLGGAVTGLHLPTPQLRLRLRWLPPSKTTSTRISEHSTLTSRGNRCATLLGEPSHCRPYASPRCRIARRSSRDHTASRTVWATRRREVPRGGASASAPLLVSVETPRRLTARSRRAAQ